MFPIFMHPIKSVKKEPLLLVDFGRMKYVTLDKVFGEKEITPEQMNKLLWGFIHKYNLIREPEEGK